MTAEFVISIVGAVLGGGFTIYTYHRSVKLRRAEWLFALYEKFYEQSHYKRMRWILDYEPEAELKELYSGLETTGNDELCESLVDYLNFFEFIASLYWLGQIEIREVRMLFEYYLKTLKKHKPVMVFISKQGFESLDRLLGTLGSD